MDHCSNSPFLVDISLINACKQLPANVLCCMSASTFCACTEKRIVQPFWVFAKIKLALASWHFLQIGYKWCTNGVQFFFFGYLYHLRGLGFLIWIQWWPSSFQLPVSPSLHTSLPSKKFNALSILPTPNKPFSFLHSNFLNVITKSKNPSKDVLR